MQLRTLGPGPFDTHAVGEWVIPTSDLHAVEEITFSEPTENTILFCLWATNVIR
jgi:hypothetical protein